MILIIGLLAFIAVAALVWVSVGRGVLRVGYVAITKKPSLEDQVRRTITDSRLRREGVLHLVMADHVDPGLVLVVLRLDDGGQWISTVRADQQGFGGKRLDSWRADARRVVVIEKPRASEVIFRPLGGHPAQPAQWKLPQWVTSRRSVELAHAMDTTERGVDDHEGHSEPIPRLRLTFALMLGVISIVSSLILMCTDGIDAGVSWSHHAGVSAAPLLLVAGALLAISIALPPKGRTAVLRVVTVTAFTTWGLSQLLPNTGAGTLLDDLAILLFVIDAGVFASSDAVGLLRSHHRDGHGADAEPAQRLNPTETGRAA